MTAEQINKAVKDYDECVKIENINRDEYNKMITHYENLLLKSYENFRPYSIIYKEEYGDRFKFSEIIAKLLRERTIV